MIDALLQTGREWTVKLLNLPSHRAAGTTDAEIDDAVWRAFQQWSFFTHDAPIGVTFRWIPRDSNESADISVEFRTWSLFVLEGAEGQGGTKCGQVCSPADPRYVWLNDLETWTPLSRGRANSGELEMVVLHELGHVLGLSHYMSSKCDALSKEEAANDSDCFAGYVMSRFSSSLVADLKSLRCEDWKAWSCCTARRACPRGARYAQTCRKDRRLMCTRALIFRRTCVERCWTQPRVEWGMSRCSSRSFRPAAPLSLRTCSSNRQTTAVSTLARHCLPQRWATTVFATISRRVPVIRFRGLPLSRCHPAL